MHIPGTAVGGSFGAPDQGSRGMMLPWPRCQQQALAVHCALVAGEHTTRPRKPASPLEHVGTGLCAGIELQAVKNTSASIAAARTNG